MPAGFQVIGSHGFVQIDENYFNMAFVQKGAFAVYDQQLSPYSNDFLGSFSYAGRPDSPPVVCIKGQAYLAAHGVSHDGNGNYTFAYIGDRAVTVSYWVFDRLPVASTNKGIEVYSAGGQPVFNSDIPAMRIRAVYTVPSGTPIDPGLPWTHQHIYYGDGYAIPGEWAVCLTQSRVEYTYGYFRVEGVYAHDGALSTGDIIWVNINGGAGNVDPIQPVGGKILLIDTAGL